MAFGQSGYVVCKEDARHEVCRFSNGNVTESICTAHGCSIFHWTRAEAVKRASQLRVQPSYEEARNAKVQAYMQKGLTLGEAEQRVHNDVMSQPDPGVEKARVELCKQGILEGIRCKKN